MKNILFIILIFSLFGLSCREKAQQAPIDPSAGRAKQHEALIKMNTYVARRNQELISRFVNRTGLDMKPTGSGLWCGIYSNGMGRKVSSGDLVEFTFTLKLLDGTPIDSAGKEKPKTFRVGKGGVESGLEEGMLLLHEGDSARLIIPPHLAFGNFGDQGKIPPGAFLFYDIYLAAVKK